MEKRKNPISNLINETFKYGNPDKLNYVFRIIKESLETCDESISAIEIEKLNKITLKSESVQTRFASGAIYNLIFSRNLLNLDSLESNKIIEIVNSVYVQYDFLRGTQLSKKLRTHIKYLLNLLKKRPELSQEDVSQVEEILERPDIKLDAYLTHFESIDEVKTILENLNAAHFPHKQDGLISLIEVLSKCSSIEEQYEILCTKSKSLIDPALVGANEKAKSILDIICILMDHVMFQSEYLMRIMKIVLDPKTDLEAQSLHLNYVSQEESTIVNDDEQDKFNKEVFTIIPFRITEEENFLKSNERIVPIVMKLLNTLAKFRDLNIQKSCLIIIERIYYTFPKMRSSLEDLIINIFNSLNLDKNEFNKREASSFLYRLINRDASFDFKQQIEKRESFKSLYETKYFDQSVLDNTENVYGSLHLRDLQLKTGFPLTKHIESGETYFEYVEVWKPYSIIYWAIILEAHDINVTVSRVITFEKAMNGITEEPHIVYEGKKIEASTHHARWTLIAKDPGIYKIEFDNSYSWFKSKTLKLLISVLEPDIDISNGQIKRNIVQIAAEESKNEEKKEIPAFTVSLEQEKQTKVKGLIYLNPSTIDFHISSSEKSFEIMINYAPESINWEQINERLLDTLKRLIDVGRTSRDNKFSLKIIFSSRAFKSLFPDTKYDTSNFEEQSSKLISMFSFLNRVSNNLDQGILVHEDIDIMLTSLLNNKIYSDKDFIYTLSIDNFAKAFRGKYKSKSIEIESLDINKLCFPHTARDGSHSVKLVTELYFEEKTSSGKVSYLASLMIAILCSHAHNITHFHILQDDSSLDFITNDQEKLLRKYLKTYLEKYDKKMEIILNDLRMSEIINL